MATQRGLYSKAIKALTSDGLPTFSSTVLQEMLDKHPQFVLSSVPPGPVPSFVPVLVSVACKAVMSFPNGSALGPSDLRPSHLWEAVSCMCPSPD